MTRRSFTADELDAQRAADHTYFLTLFRDMLRANMQKGRTIEEVAEMIDGVIAKRERAA